MSDREQFCLQTAEDIVHKAETIIQHSCAVDVDSDLWHSWRDEFDKMVIEFRRALDAIPCDHFGTDRIDGKCAWCGEAISTGTSK